MAYLRWVPTGIVLTCLIGCSTPPTLRLRQPSAPPAQRDLRLTSAWTYSHAADGVRRCLLAYPLPGSADGPRDFLVYVVLPAQAQRVAVGAGEDSACRGFLIQAVGDLHGKAQFVSGRVAVEAPRMPGREPLLKLDVRCEDGTWISGQARIVPSAAELRDFERRFAADVAALFPGDPANDPSAGSTTEPRSAGR